MTLMTYSLLRDGGSRIVTFAEVAFQMTLPALDLEGKPSIPVTVNHGLHVLFKYISGKSSWLKGVTPGSKLRPYSFGPKRLAMNLASSQKYSGISTYSSSMTFPV